MTESVDTRKDESISAVLDLACAKCSGRTAHIVLASIDDNGSDDQGAFSFEWIVRYQIVECRGCKSRSFREEHSNSEDWDVGEDGHQFPAVNEVLYPPRLAGRKGIGDHLQYLPAKVRQIYSETLAAVMSNSPILAGIGLRALLETVCKEKRAVGKVLADKIDDLEAKRILTPISAKILHRIRNLGNDAAHEVKPHTLQQLGVALDVVEHLLKDVYILPHQMKAQFKEVRRKRSKR